MVRLIDLLTSDQILEINKYYDSARRRHPAWSVMNAYDEAIDYERSCKDLLTNDAIAIISLRVDGKRWLTDTLKRVANVSNFEEAVSAIAEICCYGAMLKAGFDTKPIPTKKNIPTPDFEFELGETYGVIEVAAKLEHDEQTKRSQEITEGQTPDGVERFSSEIRGGRIDYTISVSHPFGVPDPEKAGDTTQTNAISRICQIKAKETQFAPGKPSLLWIDFRDLGKWPGVLSEEQCAPLMKWQNGEAVCSGAIWYAFYGWKGAPVFDDSVGLESATPMGHEGRFSDQSTKKSCYSGAIICLEKATVFFENPHSLAPLCEEQRTLLKQLPGFNVQYSIAEWKKGEIISSLSRARLTILSAAGN